MSRDEVLARYRIRPELTMLQWRGVIQVLAVHDERPLLSELMEAMCADEASPDVPPHIFGLLTER